MSRRILCNLPLECFEDRDQFHVELCTFGPIDRMWVDGVHYPFDVEFDPSVGSWDQLQRRLPAGFVPDLVLIYWPEQEPLPRGLHRCPVPVVGVVSDYNLSLPYLAGLWPFFDVLLCDRSGVELFRRLSFGDVRYFCQYSFKRPFHRRYDDVAGRDLDVAFAGNLNPEVQRERAPWIERVRGLAGRGLQVTVQSGVHGAGYGRLLNRTRIGWNRSIRGEMNLRAFEVPACGALLFQERENLEVAEFLQPGEEVVLYGDDDFEELVLEHLADERRLQRMARAGQQRIQQYSMGRRLDEMCTLLGMPGPGRPPCQEGEAALARAVAMLTTWAKGPAAAQAAVEACRLLPDDPRALNTLALATLRWQGAAGGQAALQLLHRACSAAPGYVPAAHNFARLLTAGGADARICAAAQEHVQRRAAAVRSWGDVDGPALPLGFAGAAVDRSLALQSAVRIGDPQHFADTFLTPASAASG